jgi:hypothetical protein
LATGPDSKGGFKIDMCFSYTEEGQSLLQWCQGVVTVKKDKAEKYNYLDVEVKWKDQFVESECKITRQKLKNRLGTRQNILTTGGGRTCIT